MADSDKELKIGIAIEATGNGAAQSRDEIESVGEATDALKDKVDAVSETSPEVQIDATAVEEAKDSAAELVEAVETVDQTEAAPQVDATSVEAAAEATEGVTEALDTLAGKETVIEVDSSALEEASENAEEATEDIEESGSALEDALGSGSNVSTISSGVIDLSKELKTVSKLMKTMGINAGGAAGLVGKLSLVMKVLNATFRANPILAVAGALGALITVLGYFKSKAEDAAKAQESVADTAKAAEEAELKLAEAAGYVADRHGILANATDKSKEAISRQNREIDENRRLMDLSIDAVNRRTDAEGRIADATRDRMLAEVDLQEANKTLTADEANQQRADIRAASENSKFASDQKGRKALLEKYQSEQNAVVEQLRQQRALLAETEANLGKGGPSADAQGALERAKAQMEDAQKALDAARDRTPQIAIGGMAGQIAASQEAVAANVALEESKQKVAEAEARIRKETEESNVALKNSVEEEKAKLAELEKAQEKVNDRFNNRAPALREEIELQEKLKEQADAKLELEKQTAEVKAAQAKADKEAADEADQRRANAPKADEPADRAPSSRDTSTTSTTDETSSSTQAQPERATRDGRINARPTHVRGAVTGAIDQPIGLNAPAQGGTDFREALRPRGNGLNGPAPAAPGATPSAPGQAGGGDAKQAAEAAKKLAAELAGLKDVANTLGAASKEIAGVKSEVQSASSTLIAEIRQLKASVKAMSRV